MKKKRDKSDIDTESMEILKEESEKLFFTLSEVSDSRLPELAELIVTLSLKFIIEEKGYKGSEDISTHDFIEATRQGIAWLEYVENQQRH